MFLHLPGCPEFVEGAFCHARENVDHGVQPILLRKHRGERLSVTRIIQTVVYTWSLSANAITSSPNVRKAPLKNLSIRNIWPAKFMFEQSYLNATYLPCYKQNMGKILPIMGLPTNCFTSNCNKIWCVYKINSQAICKCKCWSRSVEPFSSRKYLNSFLPWGDEEDASQHSYH